jgi:hypothetical protein
MRELVEEHVHARATVKSLLDARRDWLQGNRKTLSVIKGKLLELSEFTQDYRFLREGDHVIYLGPRGKEQADYLNRLDWNIVARSIEDLK